jgi:hypothetical protein
MKRKLFYIFGMIILFNTGFTAKAQDWEWAKSVHVSSNMFHPFLGCVDKNNNLYIGYYYSDTIVVQGHSFFHQGIEGFYGGLLIVKYTPDGEAINFIDISASSAYETIWSLELKVDDYNNLYLAGDVTVETYINDTVISPTYIPDFQNAPVVLVVKFDSDFNIDWSKMIQGSIGSQLQTIFIIGDNLYVSATHHWDFDPFEIVFFDQDTIVATKFIESLTCLNLNAEIQWIKIFDQGYDSRFVTKGNDNMIYIYWNVDSIIKIDSWTFEPPDSLVYYFIPLITKFDSTGKLIDGFFKNWSIDFYNNRIDKFGNQYFCQTLYLDSAIIDDYVIKRNNDSIITVFGKLNNKGDLQWIKTIKSNKVEKDHNLQMILAEDDPTLSINHIFQVKIGDSVFINKHYYENIICFFDSSGLLKKTKHTDVRLKTYNWGLLSDNCKNLYLSSGFQEDIYFNQDTLDWDQFSLFLAKLDLGYDPLIRLPDTTIYQSRSVQLNIIGEYDSCYWSTGDTTITVNIQGRDLKIGTNLIWYDVFIEGCGYSDTIYINVIDDYGMVEEASDFYIYPNPFDNELVIKSKAEVNEALLLDMIGHVVYRNTGTILPDEELLIHTPDLARGIYTLRIKQKDKWITKKIIHN